jgi:hypothetical protein
LNANGTARPQRTKASGIPASDRHARAAEGAERSPASHGSAGASSRQTTAMAMAFSISTATSATAKMRQNWAWVSCT